ncbi:hypothetical protein NQ317_010309 [Molorchus minor]|uniref:Nuclear condensin complex subunit 3 C-terminal domain-containing protein n=1 Tax=Molorchus minor TaxID=1323400 RepID=A0ABQ9IYZ4_9CUCU|nr:hypothetical protein NQ317_010309 [Molorchus minor]
MNVLRDELERILPEFVYFSNTYYTQVKKEVTTVEFLEQQFILKQFFMIIKTYDFADVTNRQYLNSLVCNILEKAILMSDVTELVISTLENTIPNIDSRSLFVSEIISEIMYPMNSEEGQKEEAEKEYQLSQIRVKMNCLLEEQSEAVRQEKFIEADRLKHEIGELHSTLKKLKEAQFSPQQVKKKTDIPTIIKYLDVAAGLLLSPQITCLTPSLKTLKDNVIQELLIYDNDNVRAKALRCYALCCIVDKQCASSGIHIFSTPIFAYQIGEECDTQTLLICIGAVVDLLRIYGSQLMAAPSNEALSESMEEAHERVFAGGTSLTDLIQGLVDLMDDEQYEIQEKAAYGLCQLVLKNDAEKLTQFIGYTLNRIPSTNESASQLEEAVLMTIKAIAFAPKISPLADVNIENIAKFMIALCKTSPEGPNIHKNLASTLCFEIKGKPKNKLNLILSKILLMLDIPDDKVTIKDLQKICDQIRDDVTDRTVLNNIVKFASLLTSKYVRNISVIEETNKKEDDEVFNNLSSRNI